MKDSPTLFFFSFFFVVVVALDRYSLVFTSSRYLGMDCLTIFCITLSQTHSVVVLCAFRSSESQLYTAIYTGTVYT